MYNYEGYGRNRKITYLGPVGDPKTDLNILKLSAKDKKFPRNIFSEKVRLTKKEASHRRKMNRKMVEEPIETVVEEIMEK